MQKHLRYRNWKALQMKIFEVRSKLHDCRNNRKFLISRVAAIGKCDRITLISDSGKSNGGFRKGGSCNNRFVLKADVRIASEVSIFSKNSLAITDFLITNWGGLCRTKNLQT